MGKMIQTWTMVLLCIIIGLAACGGSGGGGGGEDPGGYEVTGPASLLPGALGTYQISSTDDVGRYRWRVEGDGVLKTMADQPSVIVKASNSAGGGAFIVYCDVKVDGAWQGATPLEVKIGALPRFRVVLNTPNNLTPTTLTGSSTLTMTSNAAGAATWSLYFVGDTSGLPKQVQVTVQTTNGAFTLQNVWLNLAKQTKILSFPRTGGGSVGLGGSVWDLGAPRPALLVGGPGESATATLSAKGVETMVITVKYQ